MASGLKTAFNAVKSHPLLVSIPHRFGKRSMPMPTSAPYVHWYPHRDTFAPPIYQHKPKIRNDQKIGINQPNRKRVENSLLQRRCGCEVRLYQKTEEELEDLIEIYQIALRRTFVTQANYAAFDGEWMEESEISENNWGYRLNLTVFVPILDLGDYGTVTSTEITEEIIN